MSVSVECVLPAEAKLGESPVWSSEQGVLYWVDIEGRAVHAFTPGTGVDRSWELAVRPSALGLTSSLSRLVVAAENQMAWLDLDTGELDTFATLEEPQKNVRLNDGRTDPAGRFWVGSMYEQTSAMRYDGYLHRVEPDGTFVTVRSQVGCANGSAFSPDGKTMYWAESLDRAVFAYDYDVETGEQSNERVFLEFGSDLPGKPDGAAVDETGCYWTACVGGSAVARITPEGKIDRVVAIPVLRPTMPAFGGPDLETMFITTIGARDPEQDGPGDHGGIFAFNPGVKGLPEPRFGE